LHNSYECQAYETGIGIVKPLFYDYPANEKVRNDIDAWLFGEYLLVAPVVNFAQHFKSVYLPAGRWIDYFRGDIYEGNREIHYPVNADTWMDIPLFIKEGAIIPSQDVQNFVREKPVKAVYVDVFPGSTGTSFSYYDDHGDNYDYEKGVYFKQIMTTRRKGPEDISFNIEPASGSYKPTLQFYLAAIHGQAGNRVKIKGVTDKHFQDLNAFKAAQGEGWVEDRDLYGAVTYVKIAAQSSNSKNIAVTGTRNVTTTAMKYEAEEVSLTGGAAKSTALGEDWSNGNVFG
jgi:alpha-glucosidase (family GH31 glycosyl hydrolase)